MFEISDKYAEIHSTLCSNLHSFFWFLHLILMLATIYQETIELPTYSAENCLTMDCIPSNFLFWQLTKRLSSRHYSSLIHPRADPSFYHSHIPCYGTESYRTVIRKLDSLSCFLSFNTPRKRMHHIRVHRLSGSFIRESIDTCRYSGFYEVQCVDCSRTIHICSLSAWRLQFICQINLLCFLFPDQPECCLQLSYLHPAYNPCSLFLYLYYTPFSHEPYQ